MISTPIRDFARRYAESNALRLHMPGHKGVSRLGCEAADLTEIDGADDLYHAHGIIAESEQNASALFGCDTFYSTEGSSLCIRAMLFLAMAASGQARPLILAGRNAHKTFLNAAVVLDFQIGWLYPSGFDSYHSCSLTPEDLENALSAAFQKPCAVYLTSPDYLGNTVDLAGISAVCRKYGILLLVDNAHGAYLKFLPESRHPMDLGADLCCDSAHKTLPVLTGGAYLHVKDPAISRRAKDALALFGSTSPSYLIMQSLDLANPYLERLPGLLTEFIPQVDRLKERLRSHGFSLCGNEPLKITLMPKSMGYSGTELSEILDKQHIICEFSDPDYIVFMLTPDNTSDDLSRLGNALCSLPRKETIFTIPPRPAKAESVLTPREAVFAPHGILPVDQCAGQILAAANVGCPPAIPIVMCGERISPEAIALFRYYGIEACEIVR